MHRVDVFRTYDPQSIKNAKHGSGVRQHITAMVTLIYHVLQKITITLHKKKRPSRPPTTTKSLSVVEKLRRELSPPMPVPKPTPEHQMKYMRRTKEISSNRIVKLACVGG